MIDDCELRNCNGIMIINQNSDLSKISFDDLQDNEISVIRIKPDI